LGELAVAFPSSGGFYEYSSRFISQPWGFAMGYNYAFQWMIAVPLELTVCAVTMSYWDLPVTTAEWIIIFLVAIAVITLFGSAGYAEEEFWSALLKVCSMVVFMVVALICLTGNGPANGKYTTFQGGQTWSSPGALSNGFKGICSVFVMAGFALNGTELLGLAVAETANPARSFPKAVKKIFWRCIM
jgi:yeast amino acid transporter